MANDTYTHGHHESVLRSHRWRTAENSAGFLLEHLRPGMALLDVGCGPGNITAELANRLGDGTAMGIDLSSEVVALAASDFSKSSHPNLSFAVDDVYGLSFAHASFDVVYAHQVLQHLSDPIRALEEMRRVLRPGGILAVRDADYGAFTWWPSDPLLDRWLGLYHEVTSANQANADAGRRLLSWVRAAGFDDVVTSSSTWTFATDDERQWWGGLWADRIRESDFARQALAYGLANEGELAAIAEAFLRWSVQPDGVFVLVHGEVLGRR